MSVVEVHLSEAWDVHVGTLYGHRRRGAESATFIYSPDYLGLGDAYALDPELPLAAAPAQTRVGRSIFGAFADSAPDRWGRTLLTRRELALARADSRTPRSLGETDFLLGVRDDLRHGALRFCQGGSFLAEVDSGVPALTDLPGLLDLATRAEADEADLPDLQRLVRVGSSLGGARPKAHVRDTNGRLAIAKFPSSNHDTWNVMAWEMVALDLAAASGIKVAPSRLLDLAGRSVLVTERFDRTAEGARIGYVSAMTMLEASDGDQRSYLEIGEVIEQTSARASQELRQLWLRIVFSVLISNTDNHLRNHGFLHERGDVWRLAPAFDLNPDPAPGPTYLSTSIDDGDDVASVGATLAVAGFFRLSFEQGQAQLRRVAKAVGRWPVVAQSHGLSSSEIARMAPAFAALDQVEAM